MGLLPSTFWQKTAEMSRASAEGVGQQIGTLYVEKLATEGIPDLQYVPFYIAHSTPAGEYRHKKG